MIHLPVQTTMTAFARRYVPKEIREIEPRVSR